MNGDDRLQLCRRLGRVGAQVLMISVPIATEIDVVQRLDRAGYGSFWMGETVGGKEAFSHAAALLAQSDRIIYGTGIANIWAREPATMQAGATVLSDAWPDRFVLGVGVSHAEFVTATGQQYVRPLQRMTDYLHAMAEEAGRTRYPVNRPPVVLGALRPRMLGLAASHADGATPYLVPPSHTPLAREILGPEKLLIPGQAFVLNSDRRKAHALAREHIAPYLQRPNYVNNLRWLGYTSDDLSAGGSDRLVDGLVVWGDERAIRDRVDELLASGADHVLLQPLGASVEDKVSQLERVAPAVL